MDRGAQVMGEVATKPGKRNRLAVGYWAQRAKEIWKRMSNFQNLRLK
jgi:hypothetical protein